MVVARENLHPLSMDTYCYCCSNFDRMQLFQHGIGIYLAICHDCIVKLNSRPELNPYLLSLEIKEAL